LDSQGISAIIHCVRPPTQAGVNCEDSEKNPFAKQLKAMEARITKLEEQIAKMRPKTGADDDGPDQDEPSHFSIGPIAIEPEKKRPGAPCRFTKWEFTNRRDGMVFFIENFWPEFVEMFSKANPKPKNLQDRMRDQFRGKQGYEPFDLIVAHPNEFWEAVYGKEIPRIPRRLAYALAGVERMELRSSLARCDREPSETGIHIRAMDEHIRREHPDWYRKLTAKGVCPTTIKRIPKGCKDCERFRCKPELLTEALAVKPFRWDTANQSAHTVEPPMPEAQT